MSVIAVMLVKDEEDIIDYTVRYLLSQVDAIHVLDNGSTDGTREKLAKWDNRVRVTDDDEVAYYQAEKTSALAAEAFRDGFDWVVPCDADEFWYSTDGRPLREFFGGLAPDVAFVNALLFNHLPTADDDLGRMNPFRRIGHRQRDHGAMPKVACRLRPGLEIRQGNHDAYAPGSGVRAGGLVVRHFSWRSADQYVKKLRNGYRAYAATTLSEDVGAHWRMFGPPDSADFDERVREHYETWFHVKVPGERHDLIFDPAPWPL